MGPELDTVYLAEQLKFIRKLGNLTQANVADLCGLSTRTIEKLEGGRHRPDEQTLRSLARGLGFKPSVFRKPNPEEQVERRRAIEKSIRTSAAVGVCRVRTPQETLGCLDTFDGWMSDITSVVGDEALEAAAALADLVTEDGELWPELSTGGQLEIAKNVSAACRKLEDLGHVCLFGRFRQVQRYGNGKCLVFNVGLLTVRTKDEGEKLRFALVQLPSGWETHPEDRVQVPNV